MQHRPGLLRDPAGHPRRELGGEPLVRPEAVRPLGTISYGLYLCHLPIFFGVRRYGCGLNDGSGSSWPSGPTFAFTLASWFLLERPALAWKTGWNQAGAPSSGPSRRPVQSRGGGSAVTRRTRRRPRLPGGVQPQIPHLATTCPRGVDPPPARARGLAARPHRPSTTPGPARTRPTRTVVTSRGPTSGDAAPRFFFVHVQKTAGTSLDHSPGPAVRAHEIYPDATDGDQLTVMPQLDMGVLQARWAARRDQIRLVTGHFPGHHRDCWAAGSPRSPCCAEPVERTLSYLRHFRKMTREARA